MPSAKMFHDITRTPPTTGGSRAHSGSAAITSGATLSSARRAAWLATIRHNFNSYQEPIQASNFYIGTTRMMCTGHDDCVHKPRVMLATSIISLLLLTLITWRSDIDTIRSTPPPAYTAQ